MAKAEETVLEIDLKALGHNYNVLRSKIKPENQIYGGRKGICLW